MMDTYKDFHVLLQVSQFFLIPIFLTFVRVIVNVVRAAERDGSHHSHGRSRPIGCLDLLFHHRPSYVRYVFVFIFIYSFSAGHIYLIRSLK